jgi:hypothetical protein
MPMRIVAQAAAPETGWLSFDNVFWMSVLLIFVLTVVGALIRMRQRDKCLKLFAGHHVTYVPLGGRPVWGDLVVASSGLEVLFDAPGVTGRGLMKTSTLLFPRDLARCLALCRSVHGLTDEERRSRERQIRRSFNPGPLRRLFRWVRNIINTIRDAFTRSLNVVIGRVMRTSPVAADVQVERGGITEVGATVFGALGNAYEPLLERHIGKPVILELNCSGQAAPSAPGSAPPVLIELPGYLVDYTERFLAVFNIDHEPVESISLRLTESASGEGYAIDLSASEVVIRCTGPDVLVVRHVASGGPRGRVDLVVSLPCSASLRLRRDGGPGEPVQLELERTRSIDIVCPRELAQVRFGSATLSNMPDDWQGVAPQVEDDEVSSGVHRDGRR